MYPLTTCPGAGFDTALALYSGTCDNLVQLDCNDDDESCALSSTLSTIHSPLLKVDTEYFGVFGQIEYSISDQMRLIAGIRYNDEEKSASCGGSNFTGDENGDGTVDRVVNIRAGVDGTSPLILPDNARDLFTYN